MNHPKSVTYLGRKYWLQSTGRYYQSRPKSGERLLHRFIWIRYRGAIPKGMFVHHKDGDWTNNAMSNLKLMEAGAHSSMHLRERFKDKDFRARNAVSLMKAQEAAKAWHSSPEGLVWHRAHGIECWKKSKMLMGTAKCRTCKKDFKQKCHHQKFCSSTCRNKLLWSKSLNEKKVCVICSSPFTTSSRGKTITCSFHCRGILRGRRMKAMKLC